MKYQHILRSNRQKEISAALFASRISFLLIGDHLTNAQDIAEALAEAIIDWGDPILSDAFEKKVELVRFSQPDTLGDPANTYYRNRCKLGKIAREGSAVPVAFLVDLERWPIGMLRETMASLRKIPGLAIFADSGTQPLKPPTALVAKNEKVVEDAYQLYLTMLKFDAYVKMPPNADTEKDPQHRTDKDWIEAIAKAVEFGAKDAGGGQTNFEVAHEEALRRFRSCKEHALANLSGLAEVAAALAVFGGRTKPDDDDMKTAELISPVAQAKSTMRNVFPDIG